MEPPPPNDKWNLLFLTLLFHGLGTLIAWNMFITAKDYFVKFKLADTVYAQNFLAYVGWAAQIPNLLFNWFNVFVNLGGSLSKRIVGAIIIMIGIFVVTIVLAILDTRSSPGLFFWLTMICIFFMNGCNAIYQNSVFGVAARLPQKFMGAYVLGNNLCGILVVGMQWLSTFFESLRTSAIYYFLCGMFVLVICLDTYIALPINKFYRHCRSKTPQGPSAPGTVQAVPYGLIFRQTKAQLYNAFMTYFVTLAVFPAVISDVVPVKEGFLGKHFMLVTCFLTFSVMAMVGNITAGIWRIPSKQLLIIFTSLRLVFIPLFLLCNYQVPGRTMPVMIASDWVFWIIVALFAWSSGHGNSLAMMYVGGEVAPEYAAKAGMIGAAMLMSGLITGVLVTRLLPIVVTMKPSKELLIILTSLRLVFIPLFLLCNYQVPGRTMPVMIASDWVFWIMSALFGWSSGHGSSLAMMYVGGEVAPEYAAKAGMIGAAMLMSGLITGVVVTRLLPIVVTLKVWGG